MESEDGRDGIEALLEEMIALQRKRVIALGRRLAPELSPDDLLQPHDHARLAGNPEFNFEDGVLAGYLAFRAAFRARRRR
jgi:hypothetical protein